MEEIQLEHLVAQGYREDKNIARGIEWFYNIAMILGLLLFCGSILIIGQNPAMGYISAGSVVIGILIIGYIRLCFCPKDKTTGAKLKKYRYKPITSVNDEIIYVNHRNKTFFRKVIQQRDWYSPN